MFERFRLRPRLLSYTLPAAGIGGIGDALGTAEWPFGLQGYNGQIAMKVLNNEKALPLTPVGISTDLETVIDLERKL